MKNVYYDGDSYSCTLTETFNTGILLREHFGGNLKHYGYPGKGPEKTIRTAMRHCLDAFNKDFIYFIGIGVPYRLEMFEDDTNYNYPNDWLFEEHPAKILVANEETIMVYTEPDFCIGKLLSQLVALHDFLEFHNKEFILHNLGVNYPYDMDFDFGKLWLEESAKRPKMVNFFNDSLHDLMDKNNLPGFDHDNYGYHAHPTDEGHKMYAEYLLGKYKEIYDE